MAFGAAANAPAALVCAAQYLRGGWLWIAVYVNGAFAHSFGWHILGIGARGGFILGVRADEVGLQLLASLEDPSCAVTCACANLGSVGVR